MDAADADAAGSGRAIEAALVRVGAPATVLVRADVGRVATQAPAKPAARGLPLVSAAFGWLPTLQEDDVRERSTARFAEFQGTGGDPGRVDAEDVEG